MTEDEQLLKSCRILFGSHLNVSPAFLNYIQIAGVKSAYREKVKETHPDFKLHQRNSAVRGQVLNFLQVQESYETLTRFLENRQKIHPVNQVPSCPTASGASKSPSPVYPPPTDLSKSLVFPQRRLLLGDFLCYSGIVQRTDIVHAILWQKASRPRLGELACLLGWLQESDIQKIFRLKESKQRFGEAAVGLGILDLKTMERLLFYQKCRQKKIGQYFIHKNILTLDELRQQVRQLWQHNYKF